MSAELEKTVKEAWKQYNDLSQLARIDALLQSQLCQPSLLTGDRGWLQGFAVRALLDWGLQQLEKLAQEQGKDGGHNEVRAHVLRGRFLDHLTQETYRNNNNMNSVRAVRSRENGAFKAVAKQFARELKHPVGTMARKHVALTLRYEALSAEAQTALRFLAIFRRAIPIDILTTIASAPQLPIDELREYNVAVFEASTLAIHPQMRDFVRQQTVSAEQAQWHSDAAPVLAQHEYIIEATYHYQQVGAWEQAAKLLLKYEDRVGPPLLPVDALEERLQAFPERGLAPDIQARRRLLWGRIAEWRLDLVSAETQYNHARRAPTPLLQARAEHGLARVYKSKDVEAARRYCEKCRQLIGDDQTQPALELWCENIFIECIIIIEQLPNQIEIAQTYLDELEIYLDRLPATLQSDYYERRAVYFRKRKQHNQELKLRQRAYDLAFESTDVKRQLNCQYNRAATYWSLGRIAEARQQALHGLQEARKAHDDLNEAQFKRLLGWCDFDEKCYDEAIGYYQEAHDDFHQISHKRGNPQATQYHEYVGAVCYDLAEVYLEGELDINQARRWWRDGMRLAQEQNNRGHIQDLNHLSKKFPELDADLNKHQVAAIRHLRKHKQLTTREYANLFNVSDSTASRSLKKLLDKGIVQRTGKARGAFYTLVKRS